MQPSTSTRPEPPLLSQTQEGIEQLGRDVQVQATEWVMSTLHYAPEAAWDLRRRQGCMNGTRITALNKLMSWSEDPDGPSIFWLTGMAGTGKSAIGTSVCQKLEEKKRLGGSFFCWRSSYAASCARRIIPSLAYRLARQNKNFQIALVEQLQSDPDVVHKSIAVQYEYLLHRPLSKISSASMSSYVLVIDGLDECIDHDATVDLINAFVAYAHRLPVKTLIISRSEYYIRDGTPLANSEFNCVLRLQDLPREEVDSDIAMYFRHNLNQIAQLTIDVDDGLVARLVQMSSSLFVFASTAVAYVRHGPRPNLRLEALTRLYTLSPVATRSLDAMYKLILHQAANPDYLESEELDRLKELLAVVLALRSRLSISALGDLLGMSPTDLRDIFYRLHAVINIPDSDNEPGWDILHRTFEDFLSDPQRAPSHLLINIHSGHVKLAPGCFKVICSHFPPIASPYFTSAVSAFSPSPGSNAIIYASLQWPHHHALVSTLSSSYTDEIQNAILSIAEAFSSRFKSSRGACIEYLDCAIASQHGVVNLMLELRRPMQFHINKLGDLFVTRFERLGNVADLNAARGAYDHADQLTPGDHLIKASGINNIGRALQARFSRLGSVVDLEAAIEAYHHADQLTPDDHPSKALCAHDIGLALQSRFSCMGHRTDLDESIDAFRRADVLTPTDHFEKAIYVNDIGRALEVRFSLSENAADLDEAIDVFRRANQLTPDNHPNKALFIRNIGRSLEARFLRLGNVDDQEAAIEAYHRVEELTPTNHPYMMRIQSANIGLTMQTRLEISTRLGYAD